MTCPDCSCAGPKLGLWMVLPSQLIVMVGLGIAYSVTGGSALSRIYHLYTVEGDTPFGLSCWILIFMACQLLLSQVRVWSRIGRRLAWCQGWPLILRGFAAIKPRTIADGRAVTPKACCGIWPVGSVSFVQCTYVLCVLDMAKAEASRGACWSECASCFARQT